MQPQVNTGKHSKEFLYKELTGEIIEAACKVHNTLGCGLLEKVYENSLAWELGLRKRRVFLQQKYNVIYRGKRGRSLLR